MSYDLRRSLKHLTAILLICVSISNYAMTSLIMCVWFYFIDLALYISIMIITLLVKFYLLGVFHQNYHFFGKFVFMIPRIKLLPG